MLSENLGNKITDDGELCPKQIKTFYIKMCNTSNFILGT